MFFHLQFSPCFTHGFTQFQPSPRVVDGSILFGRDFSRELRDDAVHGRVLGLDLRWHVGAFLAEPWSANLDVLRGNIT